MCLEKCLTEAIFVHHVLDLLEPGKRVPPVILGEDNERAISVAQNPLSCGRTKHIDIRYYEISDLMGRHETKMEHVPSERQGADTPTKP